MDELSLLRGKPIAINDTCKVYPLLLSEIEEIGQYSFDLLLRCFNLEADYCFEESRNNREFALYICWVLSIVIKTDIVYYGDHFLTKDNVKITKDILKEIISVVKKQNLISKAKEEIYADERARKIAEKIKAEKQKQNINKDAPTLKDIISCVCARSGSYNLLNVWDLTLYQLYDQFTRLTMIDNYQGMVFLLPYQDKESNKDIKHWSIPIKEDE